MLKYIYLSLDNFIDMNQSTALIRSILIKPYESRSVQEHHYVEKWLQPYFPTLSIHKIKLISFYARRIDGPKTLTVQQCNNLSYVICLPFCYQNPQSITYLKQITKDNQITVSSTESVLFLDYLHYLNCQVLDDSSVEGEIAFMHTSEYMCSIPKKNLYQVIREAKILPFVVGQNVYTQEQLFQAGESGSCVYFVRKGEFGCFKQIDKNSKAIEAYRYNKGNIFGHIEYLDQEAKRKHTVKCKTNQGTIYSFPPEIFRKLILPYCHSTLVLKQQKLMKSNSASFSINSQPKSNPRNSSLSYSNSFSGDTLSRRFSHTGVSMELPNISQSKNYIFTKHNNPLRESQRIEEEGLNKTNYFTLTKEGPLKHYPMASKRANFIDSQFRQYDKIERDNSKNDKLKQLQLGQTTSNRGRMIFSLYRRQQFPKFIKDRE